MYDHYFWKKYWNVRKLTHFVVFIKCVWIYINSSVNGLLLLNVWFINYGCDEDDVYVFVDPG